MSKREDLLTPVGRLVQGSLYTPQTTDALNQPLVYKTGPNVGQPRVDFYFAIAIRKGSEQHWAQTEWGHLIYKVAQEGFPNGAFNSSSFAWKIKDGDSQIPDKVGKKPCDRDGYKGHWVLNFGSGFAPQVVTSDGEKQILEPNFVNLGDYIQVFGSVSGNESTQQPGVYLNHSIVAFSGYGERIILGIDPKSVGFGKSPAPAGISPTPLAAGFNPLPPTIPLINTAPPVMPLINTAPSVMPYPAILTPPSSIAAPVNPVRLMTPKAQGTTFEQMLAMGWKENDLIAHGYLHA